MSAKEASFNKLVNVPVHYDRLPAPNGYGSHGQSRTFQCRNRLRSALEACFEQLFDVWKRPKPSIILTAGTIGDGENAHGQGYAFDLDGFHWSNDTFTMLEYPTDRSFYLGINAHLFLFFPQVLSFHYPRHKDHFHVDFNFAFRFRPESNAQTFFVQACLKYIYGKDIGGTGIEADGVDGIYGGDTNNAVKAVLADLGLSGPLTQAAVWKEFLTATRERAFDASSGPDTESVPWHGV